MRLEHLLSGATAQAVNSEGNDDLNEGKTSAGPQGLAGMTQRDVSGHIPGLFTAWILFLPNTHHPLPKAVVEMQSLLAQLVRAPH